MISRRDFFKSSAAAAFCVAIPAAATNAAQIQTSKIEWDDTALRIWGTATCRGKTVYLTKWDLRLQYLARDQDNGVIVEGTVHLYTDTAIGGMWLRNIKLYVPEMGADYYYWIKSLRVKLAPGRVDKNTGIGWSGKFRLSETNFRTPIGETV
jgi:hypothetical protein